jgi:hypothetical protein
MLWEAPFVRNGHGGLLANAAVGCGKSIAGLLTPMVMKDCHTAVLLIPPGLTEQLIREYLALREHFIVPSLVLPPDRKEGWICVGRPTLHVLPYSRLQRPEATEILDRLKPDLIIADEVHSIKDLKSTRTGRVLRYFIKYPKTRFCGWSGTIASKSIKDFAHLSALALGEGSPLPLDGSVTESWAAELDPENWSVPPKETLKLKKAGETALQAIGRRIRETRGFVTTGQNAKVTTTPVILERKPPPMPPALKDLRKQLQQTWDRPDGQPLVLALDVARCMSQLACGFYYKWKFPGNPPKEKIDRWFSTRKAWGQSMREALKYPRPHFDSKFLAAAAADRAARGVCSCGISLTDTSNKVRFHKNCDLPAWHCQEWIDWRDTKDSITYETETVWVDDYLAKDAADWALTNKGIVWYLHTALGHKIAEISKLPLHTGGKDAEKKILTEDGRCSIIVSISSHGEGRNGLQLVFDKELITTPLPSGKEMEQLLGRLNRQGQKADEVQTHVYRHVPEYRENLDSALRLAKQIEGLMSSTQILLNANVDWRI